ncbi:hypothetical protein RJ639_042414 [Escallonia herrerae]|uniref:Uncharacterized protein n=1 Tax=Escallonia herrerae TaxID=1293975 RepID=A0AA89B481_9ASTE|nr:hypothetical protein RJ639_042414 [Escallonia herrerae]
MFKGLSCQRTMPLVFPLVCCWIVHSSLYLIVL